MRPNIIRPINPDIEAIYKPDLRSSLFHGTWVSHLGKGDFIVPQTSSGIQNFEASDPRHVYMTTEFDRAQQYAMDTYYHLARDNFMINGQRIRGARPTVYQVHPRGKLFENDDYDVLSRAKVPIRGIQWQASDEERRERVIQLILHRPGFSSILD